MKKITASILSVMLMLSMVFSSSVFAAEKTSVLDSIMRLFSATTAEDTVGVQYKGHVQNFGDVGWVTGPEELGTEGLSLRLEAFYIELTNAPSDMHIMYRVQVQNVGWTDWVQDGAMAGTTELGLQVETVEIKLVDDNGDAYPDYSVKYQGHVQNVGDLPEDGTWYTDGQQLGTVGDYLRLEALAVQIVTTETDLTAYHAAVEAASALSAADYTAESWADLQSALEENVVTEDNTQAEIDAATEEINAIMDALEAVPEIDEIENFSTTGAYTLSVAFNKAVDKDAASFVVKRGLTSATVSDIEWSDDGTAAVLTLSSKIREGTYNLIVSGLTDEELTASVGTEDEIVESISFLSDNIVANADWDQATAVFEVLNQYGEDITEDAISNSIYAVTSYDIDSCDDGMLTVDLDSDSEENDIIKVTLIDDDSDVTCMASLSLVDTAGCEVITIGELYNEDDETLNLDNQGDEFYLLVSFEDQYGLAITDADVANADLKVKTSDDVVIGIPTYEADDNDQITEIEIDDEDYLALPIKIAGDSGNSTVTFISKGTGTTESVELTVTDGLMIDTVSIETPDVTIAGDMTVDIPVEVTDNNGDVVTEVDDLFDSDVLELTVTQDGDPIEANWVEEDEQIYIEVTTTSVAPDESETLRVAVTTPTDEYTYKTFKVYEDSAPEAFVELDSDVSNALIKGINAEIDYEDLIVEDQYGNVLEPDEYVLTVESNTDDVTVDDSTDPIVLTAASDASASKATITFSLYDPDDTATELDTYNAKFSIVEIGDFSSYTVANFGTIYASGNETVSDDYAVQLKVYGVTSSGKTALLPAVGDYYTVVTNTTYLGNGTDGDGTDAVTMLYGVNDYLYSSAHTSYPTKKAVTVTVTINATGEQLTSSGTVSAVAPEIESIAVVKDNYDDDDLQTTALTTVSSVNLTGGTTSLDIGNILDGTYGSGTAISVVATDTYGIRGELVTDGDYTYGFDFPTDIQAQVVFELASDDVTFNSNGLMSANVTDYSAGDSWYATFTGDSISADQIKVTVTSNAETVTANPTLTSIAVSTEPDITSYEVGASLDITGMIVTAYYSDSSSAVVTPDSVTGFDSSAVGTSTVTVSYGGYSDTFDCTIT